ncbi:MAG: YtxH domain-containing protein [Gemmatimonadetes bacterium]|nr:YtxH domain-containing protein [Gemmatimonadota bacterium]
MRNHDEGPYIVIERESGGGVGSFVLGALVGAGLALLFAPKTGAETQEELKEQARKLRGIAEERVRDAQLQLEERLGEAREGVASRYDEVRDAVSAGRAAAADARTELEGRLEQSKSAYRAGMSAAREAVAAGAEESED